MKNWLLLREYLIIFHLSHAASAGWPPYCTALATIDPYAQKKKKKKICTTVINVV